MTAPAGTEVGLYVDLVDRVEQNDVIETRSGRRYMVVSVRVQDRGKHRGRQHLRAMVLPPDTMPIVARQNGDGIDIGPARVHRIRWYARHRASGGVKGRVRR